MQPRVWSPNQSYCWRSCIKTSSSHCFILAFARGILCINASRLLLAGAMPYIHHSFSCAVLVRLLATFYERQIAMNLRVLTPLLGLALLACEGPAGPAGPQGQQGAAGANGATGAQGPSGAAGPGTRLWLPATTNIAGVASVNLPASAGSINNPPSMTCYRAGNDNSGLPAPTWLVVGGINIGRCWLQGVNGNPNGSLVAGMDGLPANWPVGVVVVY